MATMHEKQELKHIAALDGIRGFAVLLVFVFHVSSAPSTAISLGHGTWVGALAHGIARRGWMGVDLFFILSGYLITGILVRARDAKNYYQVFYARRALRIVPLYYVVLFGLMSFYGSPVKDQVWFWFNLSNLVTAFHPALIPALSHYWSLSIEEQFYMVWPLVVRRFHEKTLLRICLVAIVGCFLLRNLPIVLTWSVRWPDLLYRLTPFRIDTLCAGALLAILGHRGLDLRRYKGYLCAALAAGFALVVAPHPEHAPHHILSRLIYTGPLLCFTALIALALDPASLTARIFRNRFLRSMGLYSYCFYLIHLFFLAHVYIFERGLRAMHIRFTNEGLDHLVLDGIAFVFIFVACAISYRFFESPILNLKRFFPYRRLNVPQPAVSR